MKEVFDINYPAAVALGITVSLSMTATRYLSAKFPNNKLSQSIQESLPNNSSFSDDIKFGGAMALTGIMYGVIYNIVSR